MKVGGAAVPRDGLRRRCTAVLVSVEREEIKEKENSYGICGSYVHVSLINRFGRNLATSAIPSFGNDLNTILD
jgi:hypothetical protein